MPSPRRRSTRRKWKEDLAQANRKCCLPVVLVQEEAVHGVDRALSTKEWLSRRQIPTAFECSSFLQMNQPQRDNTRFTHIRALTCAAPLIWGAVSDPEETGTEYVAGSKGRQCQQLVATSAPAFTPDARGVPHMQSKQVYLTRGRAMQTPTSSYMACASDR